MFTIIAQICVTSSSTVNKAPPFSSTSSEGFAHVVASPYATIKYGGKSAPQHFILGRYFRGKVVLIGVEENQLQPCPAKNKISIHHGNHYMLMNSDVALKPKNFLFVKIFIDNPFCVAYARRLGLGVKVS